MLVLGFGIRFLGFSFLLYLFNNGIIVGLVIIILKLKIFFLIFCFNVWLLIIWFVLVVVVNFCFLILFVIINIEIDLFVLFGSRIELCNCWLVFLMLRFNLNIKLIEVLNFVYEVFLIILIVFVKL